MNKSVNPADLVEQNSLQGLEICEKCKAAIVEGNCNCGHEALPEKPQEKVKEESEAPANAMEALMQLPGAPSLEQIQGWKQMYAAVYVLPFSSKDLFVWRPLGRLEFQSIMSNQDLIQKEQLLQETIVKRALLWPQMSAEQLNTARAGLISTLYGVVMQGSWFISPEYAITLVEEL